MSDTKMSSIIGEQPPADQKMTSPGAEIIIK